jgi:hypothetical protein
VATWAEYGITSISFPQLGTGNGGLDWCNDVQQVMERYLGDLPIPVFIHVAPRESGFVPEHTTPSARRHLLKPRIDISLDDFLSDVAEHAAAVDVTDSEPTLEEPAPLPRYRIGMDLVISGDALRALWLDLKLRGALRINEFPVELKVRPDKVAAFLCQLGYIRPVFFDGGEGIRFVPAADETPESIQPIVPRVESLDR